MIFPFVFIVAVIFLSGSFLLLWLNAPQLTGLALMLFDWCQSILSFCTSTTQVFMAALMWAAGIVLGGGVLYAFARQGYGLVKGRRALKRFPVSVAGSVALIRDDSLKTAFTCGLINPRIYISTGLVKTLTREELRSVILHEIHHRRHRDPLRFFIAAFLTDAFFYLPIGRHLAGRLHFHKEMAADDSVLVRTKDPLNLAGALVKVALSGARFESAGAASFRGASAEGRIRRLVEGGNEDHPAPGSWTVISSLIIVAAVALSLLLPMAAHSNEPVTCSKGHCSVMNGAAPGHGNHAAHHHGAKATECETRCEIARA
ncbi:MAG: M56 family metallopeptidase, partial [Deltaproteobacteria bacterium]|nr:M56 family metallopeptidase [Deltaproteobacteria bacterium]